MSWWSSDGQSPGLKGIEPMSRIGNKPVPVRSGVTVSVNGSEDSVQGKLGTLSITTRPEVTVAVDKDANQVVVTRIDDSSNSKAMHVLTRSLINNMINGVTEGYKKELEIVGSGWNAQLKGRTVELKVGFADIRKVEVPMGVDVKIDGMKIVITGADKQAVGQCAAKIRAHKKPEPYNGKGIRYSDEHVVRKAGKAFAGGG